MSNYETLMANSFNLKNYHGSKDEKIALRTLATEMSVATDFNFGEPGESKTNFATTFNFLIGLDKQDLDLGGYLLISKLFQIRPEAYMDYSGARMWYETNKDQFDNAYGAVLTYMRENNPELLPQTR